MVQWEDPPPIIRRGQKVSEADLEFAAELRRNPGRFALWKVTRSGSTGTQVRRGVYRAFLPTSDYEVRTRKVSEDDGGGFKVYVRYVGGTEES